MASPYFSLTNILLATSVLFALSSAVPVPRSLNAGGDKTFILPTRNVWNDLVSIRPRYSSLDNLLFSREARSPVYPRSRAPSRMIPRSDKWVEATFDPREPVKRATLSKRFSMSDEVKTGTIARAIADSGGVRLPRDPWNRDPVVPSSGDVTDLPNQRLAHMKIGSPVVRRGDDKSIPWEEESTVEKSKRSKSWKEATSDTREGVVSRATVVENSLAGPTRHYSGSLWRRT